MANHSQHAAWLNSGYYRLVYAKYDPVRLEFVERLLQKVKPLPGNKLLHAACGEGTFTSAMAKKDLDVTGCDFNEEAINEAMGQEQDNLHFFQHDMRLLFWINYFDYAFSLFTTFGFYNTRREHENEIRSIAQSLRLGGLLVIDYHNVHYEEDHITEKEEYTYEEASIKVSKTHDEANLYKDITIGKDGDVKSFTEKVIKFSLGDFTEMLSYHGMQVQEVYGDYSFNSYDVKRSPRLIIKSTKVKM